MVYFCIVLKTIKKVLIEKVIFLLERVVSFLANDRYL
ncbi:MAG: hypothetical protein CFH06_00265 [Alphaproteobacteria bacterium MarineAlpha3_Bin5]|nr:MAG: hypothetical protein CFH06_00265 [Alphaproteobacteria bacterium MarineAlpha3_Bin5]